jgi:uncharacterized membrane protein YhaH (DUF805 family)/uncharacterized protein YndB with AHSA1/START domain
MPTSSVRSLARFLFGIDPRVGRAAYFKTGVLLMTFKYAADVAVVYVVTGTFWRPVDFFVPLISIREAQIGAFPTWLLAGLVVWSLPFLWIGVSMTLRRAVDAGFSPWVAVLFFVPGVNYLVMLTLSTFDTDPSAKWSREQVESQAVKVWDVLMGGAVSVALGTLAVAWLTLVSEAYGLAVFFGTPFLMGASCAYLFNRTRAYTLGTTLWMVVGSLLVCSGVVILFALEGVLCIAMAAPVAFTAAVIGGVVGWSVRIYGDAPPMQMAPCLLLIPLLLIVDGTSERMPPREVVSTIVIDAPPQQVWDAVVAFNRIEDPPSWLGRLGIAYPIEAEIRGTGVGAVRYCRFSTGPFVEPITAWEEPHRLAFDVRSHPAPLEEWSPYASVVTPHLEDYFRSVRGEFRLVELPNGSTRLEGSTWYTLDIHPVAYWSVLAEPLLHRIHTRVFRQIQRDAHRVTNAAGVE